MEINRIKKDLYTHKMQACMELAEMNKKKITDEDIKVVSRQHGLPQASLRNGWKTFQESGGKFIDYRVKTGKYVGNSQFAKPKTTACKSYRDDVTAAEAGSIIIEYMTTDIKSTELSAKHQISTSQFYSWIRELNTSGTLMGKRVLDPKKYAKLKITDVIYFRKNPDTNRKSITSLSATEKYCYKRVAEVLLNYLPQKRTKKQGK